MIFIIRIKETKYFRYVKVKVGHFKIRLVMSA